MTCDRVIVFIVSEVPKELDSPHLKELLHLRVPENRIVSPVESPRHEGYISHFPETLLLGNSTQMCTTVLSNEEQDKMAVGD